MVIRVILIFIFHSVFPSYPNDVLAGGDGQPHHAGAVHRHDAVPDAQLSAALSRPPVEEVGHHHCGQDGAPARLHHRQAQDLSSSLCDGYLR